MADTFLFNTVLLLEDDEGHAFIIKRALKDCVSEIVHCTTLQQALETLPTFKGELIISDLNLPDSRGTGHVELLREASRQIPILVLTSSTSLQDAVEAMKHGARDFLVKNFDADFREVFHLSLSRLFTTLELERERFRVQQEIELLRRAIESSHHAMAIVSDTGKVSYSNLSYRSFAALCGGDSSDLFSLFTPKVSRDSELLKQLEGQLSTLEPGGVWNSEIAIKELRDVAFGVSLAMVSEAVNLSAAGRSFVFWAQDIGEQKRRERFQREILSTTTHDLKGPLGAVVLSCDLLTPLVEKEKRASDLVLRVESAARGAINLIDEFLSARRIEEGTFILKPVSHNVVEIVRSVLDDYLAIAKARSLTVEVHFESDSIEANVDRLGLARVVGNLLSNAIKFSKSGGRISVGVRTGHDHFFISVEDTGCGMEPAEVQGIFERFSRLDKHSQVAGSGIGLFVVKSIVNAHGGHIAVTSTMGKGTSFEISLPFSPPVNARGELISLDFV